MTYPVSAALFLGQTIGNGTLTIVSILGAGAFGIVYRTFDTRTGVEYAVKRVEKEGNEYYQTHETRLHAHISSHSQPMISHDFHHSWAT
ncbi:hypothetical protein EI94DRAFT_1807066 [Lactarius quietus]|nr:hypothetical protein EI94DRAFT_1807066 [Lactarius quietus]